MNDILDARSDAEEAAAARLGFLLVDDFALLSYASVAEAFRAANILAGRTLYHWIHFSVDGAPARASSGLELVASGELHPSEPLDLLFVFAGGNPARFNDRRTFQRLRDLAARGVAVAGVSGGSYLLARAGLLDGYRCTIHWEHEPAFVEAFPQLRIERSLFVIDRGRLSCAGGTAGLDLALELIRRHHGGALAARVGEWFIQPQPREGAGAQRLPAGYRQGVAHKGLAAALEKLEATLSDPLDREALAAHAGLSVRQLERLFLRHLGTSIGRHHRGLRLDMARRLLRETDLSRVEIAVACGFSDMSHFSRAFRTHFGVPPSQVRRRSGNGTAEAAIRL